MIDLLSMKAYAGVGDKGEPIPADYADAAEEGRLALVESAAEGDDALLMKYLEGEELSAEEIMNGLKTAVRSGELVPVFASAATEEIGIARLLDALIGLMPSPADGQKVEAQGATGAEELPATDTGPLAVYVWKTTADPFVGKITYFKVDSGVLHADSRIWNHAKGEEERLGNHMSSKGMGWSASVGQPATT